MADVGGIAADRLRSFIERIERLEEEKAALAADIREVFAEADRALGFPLSRLCFEGPEADLKLTENTQPAILTVSVAALTVLKDLAENNPMRPEPFAVALKTASRIDDTNAIRWACSSMRSGTRARCFRTVATGPMIALTRIGR